MYLTNELFVRKSLDAGADPVSLLELLDLVATLCRKYARKLHLDEIQAAIDESSPVVGKLVALLAKYDKLSVDHIREIQHIITTTTDIKQHKFTTVGPRADQVADILQEDYPDASVTAQATDQPELYVAGDSHYYKRSLDKDLDRLLR